jgi:hypothetical protein
MQLFLKIVAEMLMEAVILMIFGVIVFYWYLETESKGSLQEDDQKYEEFKKSLPHKGRFKLAEIKTDNLFRLKFLHIDSNKLVPISLFYSMPDEIVETRKLLDELIRISGLTPVKVDVIKGPESWSNIENYEEIRDKYESKLKQVLESKTTFDLNFYSYEGSKIHLIDVKK